MRIQDRALVKEALGSVYGETLRQKMQKMVNRGADERDVLEQLDVELMAIVDNIRAQLQNDVLAGVRFYD